MPMLIRPAFRIIQREEFGIRSLVLRDQSRLSALTSTSHAHEPHPHPLPLPPQIQSEIWIRSKGESNVGDGGGEIWINPIPQRLEVSRIRGRESVRMRAKTRKCENEQEKHNVPNLTKALGSTPAASRIMNFKSGCDFLMVG